jgi:predicted dienelactone hydrolase
MKRLLLILGVAAVSLLVLSTAALAGGSKGISYPPDQLGPYSIGHTTANITDPTRNLDGSTPVTGAGRYLHLDIWYPTTKKTTDHVYYTWNNPLYNDNAGGLNWPGLPDLPALTAEGSISLNPVLDGAPLAGKGKFPLLVASHGNLVSSAKNMPDTLEALASYGYVVASVEHTGNSDAYYQASVLKTWGGGLDLGPNPSISAAGTILQRTKDVSFVIDSVLKGALDQQGIALSDQVNAKEIGVLGFSLGGQTSLATVTGIGSASYPADRRVKAAFMGGGSNWGLLLDQKDYANAKVPLMFFGNDTGIAYESFNQFTGSRLKYRVDVADYNHHIGGYESSWCQDFHNSMVEVNPLVPYLLWYDGDPTTSPSPTELANWVFPSTFYFTYTGARQSGIWDYCEPSVFDGISDDQLVAVNFGDPQILAVKAELLDKMPLKPEASVAETSRLTNWYAVSFFNKTLKNENAYSRYLTRSTTNQRSNQLVELVQNRQQVKPHPIDLLPMDKITFDPVGDTGYEVSVSSAATLYDTGAVDLDLGGDQSAYLSFPGFAFPVPGMAGTIKNLIVNENGFISTLTSPDINGIDDNGSPWYMKGHLLMSGQFTVGAMMKNLDSAAAGGVYGYYDEVGDRVIVTYSGVPAAGTTEPNTLQIAIHGNGKIEMIVGELAPTGASVSPSILGTLGLAGGHTKMRDLRSVKAIDFSSLRDEGAVFMPFGDESAIFEQFHAGTK